MVLLLLGGVGLKFFSGNFLENRFKGINLLPGTEVEMKRLCSRLRDGRCEKRKSFGRGKHNLTITVLDEAGNSYVIENVNFSL